MLFSRPWLNNQFNIISLKRILKFVYEHESKFYSSTHTTYQRSTMNQNLNKLDNSHVPTTLNLVISADKFLGKWLSLRQLTKPHEKKIVPANSPIPLSMEAAQLNFSWNLSCSSEFLFTYFAFFLSFLFFFLFWIFTAFQEHFSQFMQSQSDRWTN